VARDFSTFLSGFLKVFPELSGKGIFITGESYAGHYIPAIGAKLI